MNEMIDKNIEKIMVDKIKSFDIKSNVIFDQRQIIKLNGIRDLTWNTRNS